MNPHYVTVENEPACSRHPRLIDREVRIVDYCERAAADIACDPSRVERGKLFRLLARGLDGVL